MMNTSTSCPTFRVPSHIMETPAGNMGIAPSDAWRQAWSFYLESPSLVLSSTDSMDCADTEQRFAYEAVTVPR
jgi:hypothetical protein